MNEAQILAKTYHDRLSVTRRQLATDESGESIMQDMDVYKDVPCALSGGSGSAAQREDGRRVSDKEMVIFAGPEILMKEMDQAVVRTQAGQVFRGVTGRTCSYACSHSETVLRLESMA